jgi:hypothetical protein
MGRSVIENPAAEVLGTIPFDTTKFLDPTPTGPSAQWQTPGGTAVSIDEGPPPWEVGGGDYDNSDARRYVKVPTEWTLRWINPRLLESQGWRYWKPVTQSDPRVEVLVGQMVSPDGNVRRGGGVGDILAYMPTPWVEARRKLLREDTERQSGTAVTRQQEVRERMRRTGGLVNMEESVHPTHTQFDGRTIKD